MVAVISKRVLPAREAGRDAENSAVVPPIHRVPAHLARRFHQVCLGAIAEVTEPEDLSPLQYAMIVSIADEPGLDQRRLAERTAIDPVTAHHQVEQLEQRGLVERRVHAADRRARALRLTARGAKLRNRLRLLTIAAHERVMSALSARESATLLDLLMRVIESNASYARPGNGRRRPPKRKARTSQGGDHGSP
jgi:MarR family transcriptional regulator, temperature-dependent positive regulator of motility